MALSRFEKVRGIDALWLMPDRTATTSVTGAQALELALWARLPLIAPSRAYVGNGALFALVTSPEKIGRTTARLAEKLLAGGTVERRVHVGAATLVLGRRAADRLGVKPPRELLRDAEVIE